MEYREPINKMNTIERCEWFAEQLGELLPAEHKEVRAFARAVEALKPPHIPPHSRATELGYTVMLIRTVMGDLEKLCSDLDERTTESEEWHTLEEALAEIKRLYQWDCNTNFLKGDSIYG